MKIERQKKVRKILNFYVNNYKFRQPYQVLMDATFTLAALKKQFNIKEQLPKYFEAEVKILTTACAITEAEKLGPKVHQATMIVKQFPIHKCGHEGKGVLGDKCLKSMVKGEDARYIVATQDRHLQEMLRKIPGVPLLYLHGNAPVLEGPSKKSKDHIANLNDELMYPAAEKEKVQLLKKQFGIEEAPPVEKKKKRKGGPNPLSCKKKKKKEVGQDSNANTVKEDGKVRKRKRTRVKIPAHVKEALFGKAPPSNDVSTN